MFSPEGFCPKKGVQAVESGFKRSSYCVSWSILYAEERLKSLQSRSYLATNLLKEIIQNNPNDTVFAVEQWIVQRIHQIFDNLDYLFKELSAALEIDLTYRQGQLIYFP
jgi:hypothetical protein